MPNNSMTYHDSCRFYLTYYDFLPESGANPFGHIALLFSYKNTENEPVVVENTYGYYAPESTSTHWFMIFLKKMLGFEVDLQDGHAHLKQESMKYLDHFGLKGLTFEVNKEKYLAVLNDYQTRIEQEKILIKQLDETLLNRHFSPDPVPENLHPLARKKIANGKTRYQEHLSTKSNNQGDLSPNTLQPFQFNLSFSLEKGFDSSGSSTCKNLTLKLLKYHEVIDEKTYNKLLGDKKNLAFPHGSEIALDEVPLIAVGPIQTITSEKTQKTTFGRKWPQPEQTTNAAPINQLQWLYHPVIYQEKNHDERHENLNQHLRELKPVLLAIRKLEKNVAAFIHNPYHTEQVNRYKLLQVKADLAALYTPFTQPKFNLRNDAFYRQLIETKRALDAYKIQFLKAQTNTPFLWYALESITLKSTLLALALCLLFSPLLAPGLVATAVIATTGFAAYQSKQLYGKYKTMFNHHQQVYEKEQALTQHQLESNQPLLSS